MKNIADSYDFLGNASTLSFQYEMVMIVRQIRGMYITAIYA